MTRNSVLFLSSTTRNSDILFMVLGATYKFQIFPFSCDFILMICESGVIYRCDLITLHRLFTWTRHISLNVNETSNKICKKAIRFNGGQLEPLEKRNSIKISIKQRHWKRNFLFHLLQIILQHFLKTSNSFY